jgi:hypothetical protein
MLTSSKHVSRPFTVRCASAETGSTALSKLFFSVLQDAVAAFEGLSTHMLLQRNHENGLIGNRQTQHLVKSAWRFVVEDCNEKCNVPRRQVIRDNVARQKRTEIIPASQFQILPGFEANEFVLVTVLFCSVRGAEVTRRVPVPFEEVDVVEYQTGRLPTAGDGILLLSEAAVDSIFLFVEINNLDNTPDT